MINERNKIAEGGAKRNMSTNVVECAEQGRYCMKKFIPTRPGQTDTCIRCLEMLGELQPLPASKNKGSIWS